jgi:hypothetical protein
MNMRDTSQEAVGCGSVPRFASRFGLPSLVRGGVMRSLSGSSDPSLPALHPLALMLATIAPPVWGVAGLTLALTLLVPRVLVLALSAPLSLVLAPLVLSCRSRPGWRWGWLCRPEWFREPWSWLCQCWLRWPWLCWMWLRQPGHQELRGWSNRLRPTGA